MGNFNYPSRVSIGSLQRMTSFGNTILNTSTNSQLLLQFNDTKTGSSVPGYIDKLRFGQDATSAYLRRGYEIIPGRWTQRSRQLSSGQNIDSFRAEQFCAAIPTLTYLPSDVIIEASNRLKQKLRSHTGQSNQIVNLVELRELPQLVTGVAKSALGLVERVNKRVRNSNGRTSQTTKAYASDQWLSWSFGIAPTLGAIDDTVSSINSYLNRKDHTQHEYGIFEKEWVSATTGQSTGSHHGLVSYNGSFVHTLSCKITAGYRYSLSSGENYSLPKHFGLDISNVVPAAWELLPYSWLIDYFTTAGNFIEDSFAADYGQSSIYISQAVKYRVKGEVTAKPSMTSSLSQMTFWNTRPLKFDFFQFTRTPLSSLPRAPLRLKTANEVASGVVNKLLNLTSLLGSRDKFKRK